MADAVAHRAQGLALSPSRRRSADGHASAEIDDEVAGQRRTLIGAKGQARMR